MTDKRRRYSSLVVDGAPQAPSRAMLYPVGFKEEDFARAEFGVPKSLEPYVKQPISIRLDPDLLKAMRDTGKGWQTRANDALREHFGLSSHEDKS